MPSAEAKSKMPKYKVYKRVRDAENYAKKLGVKNVNYGGRIEIANVCNHALHLANARQMPMPESVIVKEAFDPGENEDPDELAHYIPVGGAPGEIFINGSHEGWADLEEYVRQARAENMIATDSPDHFMMHEIGELAMHQSVGTARYDPDSTEYKAEEEQFRELGEPEEEPAEGEIPPPAPLDIIGKDVSDRAMINHGEFVAETFAALMLGRDELRDNDVVMENLRKFGGDKLMEWVQPPEE